jgi:alkylated DNA repair dioxygenase AlkB
MSLLELADGGILLYDEAFLPADVADRYFVELRDTVAWEQKPGVFGHLQPRLTVSHGDPGLVYRYSGTVNAATPWTPTLLEIRRRIESATDEGLGLEPGSTRFNYCLLNRYRSGADSVGLHADDEPEMGPVIGSLSLGATRTFRIRHNRTKQTHTFSVGNGTLVIMAGTMQQFWKHEVPKTQAEVGERINLTFRRLAAKIGG